MLTEKQVVFLNQVVDGSWKENPDGSIDVDGNVGS